MLKGLALRNTVVETDLGFVHTMKGSLANSAYTWGPPL